MSSVVTFAVFGAVFLTIGIFIQLDSQQIFEWNFRYDEVCESKLHAKEQGIAEYFCEKEIGNIQSTVKGPVFVYYKLTNYLQNHRRYVNSRSNEQLSG